MKSVIFLLGVLFLFGPPVVWGAGSDAQEFLCQGCHGMPPGTVPETGAYNPGAHQAHQIIPCNRCHVDGIRADHVDGIITIRPELSYSLGVALPFPGGGGGSCGGAGTMALPAGCHGALKGVKCDWLPGKNCR